MMQEIKCDNLGTQYLVLQANASYFFSSGSNSSAKPFDVYQIKPSKRPQFTVLYLNPKSKELHTDKTQQEDILCGKQWLKIISNCVE